MSFLYEKTDPTERYTSWAAWAFVGTWANFVPMGTGFGHVWATWVLGELEKI
jgi:hypothetical protein